MMDVERNHHAKQVQTLNATIDQVNELLDKERKRHTAVAERYYVACADHDAELTQLRQDLDIERVNMQQAMQMFSGLKEEMDHIDTTIRNFGESRGSPLHVPDQGRGLLLDALLRRVGDEHVQISMYDYDETLRRKNQRIQELEALLEQPAEDNPKTKRRLRTLSLKESPTVR